jgi:hypothetical protein
MAAGLLALCAWAADAQELGVSPAMTLERSALQADVRVLQEAYEALHPGLYRYNTPAQVRSHFDALRHELDGTRTLTQAYLALSEFTAKVRCGHTWANFSNQSEDVQHGLFESGRHRLPVQFAWRDGRIVVTRDFTDGGRLPRGTEILAIDGVDTRDILKRLLTIARADGGNDAKRIDLLQVQGNERWEPFDVFLHLYYPRIGDTLALRVRAPGGAERAVSVPGLSYAQRLSHRRGEDDPRDGWRFDASDPRIAVMTMPTWALYDAKWDWKAWIEDAFAKLERDPRDVLVIDLRGNEGGLDVGDAILPHLIDKPLTVSDAPRLVRYRRVPADLAPYLDTWDPSFKDWGKDAQPYARRIDGQRYYTLRDDDAPPIAADAVRIASTLAPKAPRFAGRVFVLTDAGNSSATFEFAQRVKEAKLATLVGQPTGGNRRGINGGAFFFLRLPNSGLEVDLPLIARFPTDAGGTPPDAGIAPDIAVAPTPGDIAQGRDAWMAAVRAALD